LKFQRFYLLQDGYIYIYTYYGYINIYNIIILVRINTFLGPNIYKGDEHHLLSIGVFLNPGRQTGISIAS